MSGNSCLSDMHVVERLLDTERQHDPDLSDPPLEVLKDAEIM